MDRTADDEHPRATTTGGGDDGGIAQPLRSQNGGQSSALPGQLSLFLVGTLLFVVGLGVVVGLSGMGDVAPSGPIVNDTDTPATGETTTAGDEGTEPPTEVTATTAGPTATPSPTEEDDGGLFGDDETESPMTEETEEPTETPTPTEEDDGGLFGDDETESPEPSPSPTPTETETPPETETDSAYDSPSATPTDTDTPTETESPATEDGSGSSFSATLSGLWSVLGELSRLLAVGLLTVVTLVRRA